MLTLDFCCPPLRELKVAFVGVGRRGFSTIQRYLRLDGVEVTALCDIDPGNLQSARQLLIDNGRPTPRTFTDWPSMFAVRDLANLVVIATDWASHAEISIGALEAGLHVAVEVPMALKIADCRRVVKAAEVARRHCFMMENCCFDPFALQTLEMARRGLFGQLTHCEGAYIHNLLSLYRADGWYGREGLSHPGNPYPTHGLGPMCQLLDILRTDSLDCLTSMSTEVPTGAPAISTTLIRTRLGRTMTLHHDVSTPQPYSRLQSVCGTRGYIAKYPVEICQLGDSTPLTGQPLHHLMDAYRSPFEIEASQRGYQLGVGNMMNYLMDRHLTDSLKEGRPLAITVYDGALWSSVAELTEIAVRQQRVLRFDDYLL